MARRAVAALLLAMIGTGVPAGTVLESWMAPSYSSSLPPRADFLALGGPLASLGATPIGNGTVDAALRTAYVPVRTTDGKRRVAAVALGSPDAMPSLAGGLDLPAGPMAVIVLDASEGLRAFTESEVIDIDREGAVPVAARVQTVPTISGFFRAEYHAPTGQLFRVGSSQIDCLERTDSGFVRRGGLSIAADAMVTWGDNLLLVRSGRAVRMYQWPTGSAAPTAGETLTLATAPPARAPMLRSGTRAAMLTLDGMALLDVFAFPAFPRLTAEGSLGTNSAFFSMRDGYVTRRYWASAHSGADGQGLTARNGAELPGFVAASPLAPDALLLPTPTGGAPQTAWVLTQAPVRSAELLQGWQYRPVYAQEWLAGVELPRHRNGSQTEVAIYSSPGSSEGPWTLLARCAPTVTGSIDPEGPAEFLPLSDGGAVAVSPLGRLAVLVRSTDPEALREFASGEMLGEGFTLRTSDGMLPNDFTLSQTQARAGAVGVRLRMQTTATISSATQRQSFSDGFGTFYGMTSSRQVRLLVMSQCATVEVSDRPDFAGASAVPALLDQHQILNHTLTGAADGVQPVYVRGRLDPQVPVLRQVDVVLDTTPPGAPSAVADEGPWTTASSATFTWQPAEDSGTGVLYYRYTLTIDGSAPETISGTTASTSVTIPFASRGGTARLAVRALDKVRNVGPEAVSDGIAIVTAEPPVLNAVEPAWQAVREPVASFDLRGTGNAATAAQSSVDAEFSAPAEAFLLPGSDPALWRVELPLTGAADGLHTIHHRLTNPWGTTPALTTEVFLDTVAPQATGPRLTQAEAEPDAVEISWELPTDPAPSSGLTSAELELFREPGGEVLTSRTLTLTEPTSATLALTRGGVLRARLRAQDRAGNVSEWAAGEPFRANTRPRVDLLVADAAPLPDGRFRIRVRWRTTDAEGDPLTVSARLRPAGGGAERLLPVPDLAEGSAALDADVLPDRAELVLEARDDQGGVGIRAVPLRLLSPSVTGWMTE